MTPEQEVLRDMWLQELWPTSREVPFGERAAKRQSDWESRVLVEHREKRVA